MMADARKSTAALVASLVGLAVLAVATAAGAHTAFESSTPADGAVVDQPVDEITLTFTGPATPAGEEFVVLDPSGRLRTPDAATSTDQLIWTLRFDEPLDGGVVGVRWSVAAPDTHPIDGSFSFTVAAPTSESADSLRAVGSEVINPPASPTSSDDPVELEDFLAADASSPVGVGGVAAGARIISMLGAVLAIGGAAFAIAGVRGDPSDVRAVLFWVRRGGALLLVGAAIEAVALVASLGGGWPAIVSPSDVASAVWSSAGAAIALRAIGGILVATKTTLDTMPALASSDPVNAVRQLAAVGGPGPKPHTRPGVDDPFVHPHDQTWNHRTARSGLLGIALVAISFAFDGHTTSEGPRWLHAAANLVHVSTAATWAGGVIMLSVVIARRRRHGRPIRALQLAARFSVIATIALVVAGLTGTALSALILDSIADLWSTAWGRMLAIKVTLVAMAAAGGAYNHWITVPTLDRAPDDPAIADRLRSAAVFEACLLCAVAVATALLVAASTT